MAKKEKPILLSDNLRALIDYTGSDLGLVRSDLMKLLASAESLENGQSLRDAESQVLALEAEIADLKAAFDAQIKELNLENAELQSLLEQSNTEVNRLRKHESERKDQQGAEEIVELPVDALNILMEICEAPYSASTIAKVLNMHRVLVQHHLNVMHRAGLVEVGPESDGEGNLRTVWLSTSKGIGYLVGLGCFDQPEQKKEYLSTAERRILRFIDQNGMTADVGIADLLDCGNIAAFLMLCSLESAQWINSQRDSRGTILYFLSPKGKAWVAENPSEMF